MGRRFENVGSGRLNLMFTFKAGQIVAKAMHNEKWPLTFFPVRINMFPLV